MPFNEFMQKNIVSGRGTLTCSVCGAKDLRILTSYNYEKKETWFAVCCPNCKRLIVDLEIVGHFTEAEYITVFEYLKLNPEDSDEEVLETIINTKRKLLRDDTG